MLAPDRLNAAKLRAALSHCTIGREIVVLEETTSTNDVVLQIAKQGAAEGLVVFCEHQTAGRGQRGNVWKSAPGQGLLFSILLRPKVAVQDSALLVDWAVREIGETVATACHDKAIIKPPNDVYIMGRKIAGVLVEMRAQSGAPHLAVVGIGVNANQVPTDFPEELRSHATSLAIVRGGPVDRSALAIDLLKNLDQSYRKNFCGASANAIRTKSAYQQP
jgi:BirA family transcriptional regulator, biotin operon repressor / biotin---[acetyl-CoA-carboxylase] ligase